MSPVLLCDNSVWPCSVQKCGMSIAAMGSVASTTSSEPVVIASSFLRAFNTGNGHSRPERSRVVLVIGLSIVKLCIGE